MTPTGLEPAKESSGKTHVSTRGGAESGAVGAHSGEIDADLWAIIEVWPTLSKSTKAEILAIVGESGIAD